MGSWQGMRIRVDYYMASPTLFPTIIASDIHPHTPVSDHAGVEITVKRLSTNRRFPFDAGSPTSLMISHYNNWFPPTDQQRSFRRRGGGKETPQRPVSHSISTVAGSMERTELRAAKDRASSL